MPSERRDSLVNEVMEMDGSFAGNRIQYSQAINRTMSVVTEAAREGGKDEISG
jgi:hypothetical protein